MKHSQITVPLRVKLFVLCIIGLLSDLAAASAATMPFHTVYYHTVQGSFWAQLADDTGASPAPRQLAIAFVNNNFKAIEALGFDTVTLSLPDNDSWNSQPGVSSTLYWDLSHMANVKNVQVHAGSPTGPIIFRTRASQHSLSVALLQAGLQDFYLVDTTTGHKLLGTVVLEAQ